MAVTDALKLLREMERKYVRAIETMQGSGLLVQPPARVLRSLGEDLERARQNIRALEAAEAKPAPARKPTTKRKTKSAK